MSAKLMLEKFQKLFTKSMIEEVNEQELLDIIIPSGTIEKEEDVLDVHREGYYVRLTEALGETFEGCWFALGDQIFFSICRKYIKQNPSTVFNLSNYGNNFAEFLSQYQEQYEMPFLKDLACFDLSFKNSFHAKQHQSISIEKLQQIESNPSLIFCFGDSVRLFKSQYNVYKIWQLRKQDNDNNNDNQSDQLDINRELYLLIYKRDNQIFSRELNRVEYCILDNLMHSFSFEESLENVVDIEQKNIVSLFEIIASTGIVKELKSESESESES